MKKISLALLFSLTVITTSGQSLNQVHLQVVKDFIDLIKKKDKKMLAEKTSYPLRRVYPVLPVKDKQDFIAQYEVLFDDKLTEKIVNSNPSEDWDGVGFRGIMLLNGLVWLDYNGKLIAINYKTDAESNRRTALIEAEKNRLHPSIRIYENPKVILETSTLRIRIDDLGSGNYRYASWPIKSSMKDKPDLVLIHGELIPDGSGGNHRYSFKEDDYAYECAIMNVADVSKISPGVVEILNVSTIPPAQLTVLKEGNVILKEAAKILY